MISRLPTKKIGIFSGIFDPVHYGHIELAKKALAKADVDEVYFLVERQPRRKTHTSDYHDRLAMVRTAVKGEPYLNVLTINQPTFSVSETLPRLQQTFPNDNLCLIMGSDLFAFIDTWPDYEELRAHVSFVVGEREGQPVDWQKCQGNDIVLQTNQPEAASSKIREAVKNEQPTDELTVPAVRAYIDFKKLYR